VGFVVAGLVETLLCVASILGFVGAIVRKQTFVQAYAYFIYVHFILNIAVAGYLIFMVTHFSTNAQVKACQGTIKNAQAKDQCTGLLSIAQGVYFVVVAFVLLVEMYGALIVTRYVNQIKNEKRSARASRMESEEAFSLVPKGKNSRYSAHSGFQTRDIISPDPRQSTQEFDPYEEIMGQNYGSGPSQAYSGMPAPPVEVGYGGGSWSYKDISEEEKARLKERDNEMEIFESTPVVGEDELERRKQEIKSPMGPPQIMTSRGMEDLPRYTLSDPPRRAS